MTDTTTDTGSSGLTAAEQAYFDSRGAKTDGLDLGDAGASVAAEPPKPDPAPKPAADAAKPDTGGKAPGSDLDPDEEPLGDDGRPKNPGRFIRFGAFDKERNRRQEVERELAAEREARTKEQIERAKVNERLELLNAALTAPKAEEKPTAPAEPPDPEKDIFGYAKWQGERLAALERQLGEVNGQVGKVREQTATERAEAGLRQAYVNDAHRFSASTPDFVAAYQHLLQSRDQELAHVGHTDPQKRAALIAAEERDIVEAALRAGASPSERIYGLAKLRGYAPAAATVQTNGGAAPAAAEAKPAPAANGNGSATPAAAAPSVTDEIARIKAGQDASKSLSQAGGTAGGPLTPAMLASMPDDEFQTWVAKASKAQVRAMLGG